MVTRAGIRRVLLRWSLRVLAVVLGAVLVVAVSLLLPPTRNLWLDTGLGLALRSLPGEVTGRWSWPSLDRFEGREIVWTVPRMNGAGVDTLAVIRSLTLAVGLDALRDHDLLVKELTAEAALLDVPLIQAQFPPVEPGAGDPAAPRGAFPYLREGGVPGLPSVRVERLEVKADRLVLPDQIRFETAFLSGSASMQAGEPPRLALDSLGGRAWGGLPRPWSIEVVSTRAAGGYDPVTGAAALDSLAIEVTLFTLDQDTLRIEAGPITLTGAGVWRPDGWRAEFRSRFRGQVPGPYRRPYADLELAEVGGELTITAEGDSLAATVGVALDLDPEGDVRRGRLQGSLGLDLGPRTRIGWARIDTLDLRWRTTDLSGRGSWDGVAVDAELNADLPDLQLPALLAPGRLPGVTGQVLAAVSVRGPVGDPAIDARVNLQGRVASIWRLPDAGPLAEVWPAHVPREEFQTAAVALDVTAGGSLETMTVDLRADLGGTPWLDRGRLTARALVAPRSRALGEIRVDTLDLALRDLSLGAAGRIDTTGMDIHATAQVAGLELVRLVSPVPLPLTDLDVEVRLAAAGPWRDLAGQAALSGGVALDQADLPVVQAEVAGSARRLELSARAGGPLRLGSVWLDSLDVTWEGRVDPEEGPPRGDFTALVMAPQGEVWAWGSTSGDTIRTITSDSLRITAADQTLASEGPAVLRLGPGPGEVALEGLRLRGDLGSLSADILASSAGLDVSAAVDLLLTREWLDTVSPSPFWSAGGGVDLAVEGMVDMSTIPRKDTIGPTFTGRSQVRLIPRNEEPPSSLEVRFHTGQGDTTALLADLALAVGETPLLEGSLVWPGSLERATGRWQAAPGAAAGIDVPEQELPLDFFNRFMPPEVSLEGDVTVGAGLSLAVGDTLQGQPSTEGDVQGLVRTKNLRVNLPNRSRVDLDADLGLGGRLVDPRLTGEITVTSGLFRLPESQRALHPVTGSSALWTAAMAAIDTAGGGEAPLWLGGEPLKTPAPPYVPDLDLKVSLPGNFKVVGYGLEIELAGNFTVMRAWDAQGRPGPALKGRVRVVEGTLHALNRVFEVERGEFDLEGRVPVDPTVNLLMVTEIDGTIIRIRVTGTAMQPKIELESEPQMIQADIMAFLLFGRPLNDLDTDQRGSLGEQQTPAQQLQRNLQGLALVFGAAGIQNRISGRIGVDQVQIGSDAAGGSTLVLGKFLNPRLLLKYHQSLERSGTYFMTLEYTLNRLFKLISTYGQGEEASGLELRWQKRY